MSGVMEREISGVPLESSRFDTKMKYSTKIEVDNGTTGETVPMKLYGHKFSVL